MLRPIVLQPGSHGFSGSTIPIRNDRNLGFAAGMNAGLSAATGDLLVILNQDTVVRPDWLRQLALALGRNPMAGIAGGKALYPDGRIQHAGGVMDRRGQGSHLGHGQADTGQYDVEREIAFVTGAALAITRQCLRQSGELDTGFMLGYYEDVDWCYRARRIGASTVYVPSAVYVHAEASTSSGHAVEALCRYHRNRLRFVLKHWPMDRLLDEFGPAEYEWLDGLPLSEEPLLEAMQRVYLQYILRPDEMARWRQSWWGERPGESWKSSRLLMELRALTFLKLPAKSSARISPAATRPHASSGSQAPAMPQRRWQLAEHQFRSSVPVLGRFIVGFRRLCASFASIWMVRSLLAQQSEMNRQLMESVEVLSQRIDLLEAQTAADFDSMDNRAGQNNAELDCSRSELGTRSDRTTN